MNVGTWITQYWSVMVVAAGLIATWATMTNKMAQWDKILPNLATKTDVDLSVRASISQLKIDLLAAEVARKDAELERLRKMASRKDDQT